MNQLTRLTIAGVIGMLAFLSIAVIPCISTTGDEQAIATSNRPLFSVYLSARRTPSPSNVSRAMRILLAHTTLSAAAALGAWWLLYRRSKSPVDSLSLKYTSSEAPISSDLSP